MTVHTVMASPIGDLRIVEQDGAITAIEFSPFVDSDGRPRGARDDAHPVLRQAEQQPPEYFNRERQAFDLPLAPKGSDFQHSV